MVTLEKEGTAIVFVLHYANQQHCYFIKPSNAFPYVAVQQQNLSSPWSRHRKSGIQMQREVKISSCI